MHPSIGICLGDITGIGPEVTLKALAALDPSEASRCLIVGDLGCVQRVNSQLHLKLNFVALSPDSVSGSIQVLECGSPLTPGLQPGAVLAANAAVTWVREAAELCLKRELLGMVTAPVNKDAIVRAGHKFIGQTEFLSELAGTTRTAMMLLGPDERGRWLRVALATTHLPIRKVADALTAEKIGLAIELAATACRDLRLPRQRVAVCGLNPHAGENGQMGDEEQTLIGPAVKAAQSKGIDAVGPMSADALFYYALRGDYDAVVAMYHDQGLAPLKMACFENGVNWTLGLPFTRTSPDHGTAYDLAGKGSANPSSMISAIRLAQQLTGGS